MLINRIAAREEAPIIVSNHQGFVDIFLMHILLKIPIGLSAAENRNFPIMGSMMIAFQTIFMDRESTDKSAGKMAKNAINVRALDNRYPRLQIYPEGNTCNGSQLCAFKLGAFMPGLPVQPMVIRYNDQSKTKVSMDDATNRLDPSWCEPIGMPIHFVALRLLMSWRNTVNVKFLPPMRPLEFERERPDLFAARVRSAMAAAMKAELVDYSFTDTALMFKAQKLGFHAEVGLIEADRVMREWKLGMRACKNLLSIYADICTVGENAKLEDAICTKRLVDFVGIIGSSSDAIVNEGEIMETLFGCTTTARFRDLLALATAMIKAELLEASVLNESERCAEHLKDAMKGLLSDTCT